ncbi:tripartite tricarboxylate transporter substrate-binding protein [Muricoccus aerilatus]|uniref:tripartite tricarboxylate transporter substrate-binding protein n=1 Tax=Muricoccus aerilatus TaxID=452982 RepID=UPI0005C1E129|nr:tripartite tricarboxylate transporter substrate-binding protein [Roseomonas aerilata]
MNRRRLLRAALAAPALAGAQRATAQVAGPVTIVVPVTPGTPQDFLARLLAPVLQRRLGQAVVVENRPGASGNIGTQAVARAAPDGRTLLVQASPLVVNPSLFPSTMGYDPVEGFTAIAKLSTSFVVLVVRPDLPADSVQGLVDLARARPGAFEYASPGNGTAQHLVMTLFTRAAGIDLTHIPYSGSAQSVQDLIGRRIAAAMLPYPMAMPLAQAGQVRVLGVAAERRWEDLPGVPTLADAGFPITSPELWYALLGPAGMRPETVALLNGVVNDWLAEAATRVALHAQAMRPAGGTPEEARAHIAAQFAFWREVIGGGGIPVQ